MPTAPPLLSSFNGADENPLSEGGNWAALSTASQLRRVSNTARGQAGAVNSQSYWTVDTYGPICAVMATCTAPGVGHSLFCGLRLKDVGGANWDGYIFQWVNLGGTSNFQIQRIDNGVNTGLGTPSTIAGGTNTIYLAAVGSVLQAWTHAPTGGWKLRGLATDSTYPNAGRFALGGFGATWTFTGFYGGETVYGNSLLPILGVGT